MEVLAHQTEIYLHRRCIYQTYNDEGLPHLGAIDRARSTKKRTTLEDLDCWGGHAPDRKLRLKIDLCPISAETGGLFSPQVSRGPDRSAGENTPQSLMVTAPGSPRSALAKVT